MQLGTHGSIPASLISAEMFPVPSLPRCKVTVPCGDVTSSAPQPVSGAPVVPLLQCGGPVPRCFAPGLLEKPPTNTPQLLHRSLFWAHFIFFISEFQVHVELSFRCGGSGGSCCPRGYRLVGTVCGKDCFSEWTALWSAQ